MLTTPTTTELMQIWPVLLQTGTIGGVLTAALAFRGKRLQQALSGIFGLGVLLSVASAAWLFSRAGEKAATGAPFAASIFSDSIIFDPLFLFVCMLLSLFLFGVFILSTSLWQVNTVEWPVFWSLLLGSLIGMILLSSTRNLLFFAIAFELASLPSYILVGFRRSDPKAAEGATKYTVFGAVCSAVMIYAISLLYGLTGSLDVLTISKTLASGPIQTTTIVALVGLLVGVGFKISLVPMHFWSPDAFEGAGADIAAWLSVASKSAAVIAVARWIQMLTLDATPEFSRYLVLAISGFAVLTMTVANLSAYWQSSVKRLLAYSSIAHAGYLTCGAVVLSGTAGLSAIAAYAAVYMLMNLGAFAVCGLVEKQTGSDHIRSFSGLGRKNPVLSAFMMFFLFSLVGLPPLAGFAVKWILISALWESRLTFLVVAVLVNTVLSLFYYMRIARAIYFDADADAAYIPVPAPVSALLTVCAAGLLFSFIGWGILDSFTRNLFAAL